MRSHFCSSSCRLISSAVSTREVTGSYPPRRSWRISNCASSSESSTMSVRRGVRLEDASSFWTAAGSGVLLMPIHINGCAFLYFPSRPNFAAMPADDFLHHCQTDAGALELGQRMEALECAEHLAGVGGIKTRPVIANKKDSAAILLLGSHLDDGRRMLAGEFPGIPQQMLERNAQKIGIAFDREPWLDRKSDIARRFGS